MIWNRNLDRKIKEAGWLFDKKDDRGVTYTKASITCSYVKYKVIEMLPVENYGTDKEMDLRMAYFNAIGEVPEYLQKFEVPHSWYVKKIEEIGE